MSDEKCYYVTLNNIEWDIEEGDEPTDPLPSKLTYTLEAYDEDEARDLALELATEDTGFFVFGHETYVRLADAVN